MKTRFIRSNLLIKKKSLKSAKWGQMIQHNTIQSLLDSNMDGNDEKGNILPTF